MWNRLSLFLLIMMGRQDGRFEVGNAKTIKHASIESDSAGTGAPYEGTGFTVKSAGDSSITRPLPQPGIHIRVRINLLIENLPCMKSWLFILLIWLGITRIDNILLP